MKQQKVTKEMIDRMEDSRKRMSNVFYEAYLKYLKKEPEKLDSWRDCGLDYLKKLLEDYWHKAFISPILVTPEEHYQNVLNAINVMAMFGAKVIIWMEKHENEGNT